MRILNMIALLAMVIGFSWWVLYEEHQKNTIYVDFQNGMLEWSAEGDDVEGIATSYKGDTLHIRSAQPALLWYDRVMQQNYSVIRFTAEESDNNTGGIWGCIWAVGDNLQPPFSRNRHFPFLYSQSYILSFSPKSQKAYLFSPAANRTDSCTLQPDSANRYAVELRYEERKLTVSVNGQRIFTDDGIDTPPAGKFGIFLQNGHLQLSGLTFSRLPRKPQ